MSGNKLILIDGSSLLSTSFFGTVPREYHSNNKEAALEKMMKTSDGRYTNGVFGMVKIILKLIKKQQPTHMVVAWDISRNTFRREKYSEYKGQRKATADELKSQFPLAQETLKAMGIPQYSFDGYEADDVIGTLSRKFEDTLPVFVMTKDQDALQLISERTRVWLNTDKTKKMVEEYYGEFPKELFNLPYNFFEFTPQTFEYFYGLKPIQIIDSKAIEGDSSDNIPGVKGVGPKSVTPLLKEFGTVEAIYDYIENNGEAEINSFFKELGISRSPLNNLNKGKDMAFLSKELATIKIDMEQLDDVKIEDLSLVIDKKATLEKFNELEFNSLT